MKMSRLSILLADHAKRVVNLMVVVVVFVQIALAVPTNTMYVATNACGTADGTNWANATSNLQWAIDTISSSSPTNTVWVSNGVYNAGGVTNYPSGSKGVLTNRVAIWKAITVRSANNDPANTIIMGAKDTVGGTPSNGPAAVRCVYMNAGSTLIGFTLTNGATLASGGGDYDTYGGGAYCGEPPAAIISNCVLTGNSAKYAGGADGGALYNCMVIGNSAYRGGGKKGGTLYNCIIICNSAEQYGGAAFGSSILNNCTVVGNSSLGGGGGVYQNTKCLNCIVAFNDPGGTNNWYDTTSYFTNSCTYPTQSTWQVTDGNITNDPVFVNTNAGNYRLSQSSPCINAGLNQSWMDGAVDLDGRSRIDRFSRIVDMGCYEYLPAGFIYRGF
jgi:hypothetical protein